MNKNKFKQYKVVLRKELKDAFRDKKSIFATFVLPIILFPIFFIIIGMSIDNVTEKSINPKLTIVQNNTSISTEDETYLYFKENIFSINPSMKVEYVTCEDYKQSLLDNEIYVAIVVPKNFIESVQDSQKSVTINVLYDDRSTSASTTATTISTIIQLFSDKVLSTRVGEDVVCNQLKATNYH